MVRARVDRAHKQSNSELLTAVNRVQRSLIRGENPQRLLRELLRELIVQVGCESGFIAKLADNSAANANQDQLNLQAIDCSHTLAQKPLDRAENCSVEFSRAVDWPTLAAPKLIDWSEIGSDIEIPFLDAKGVEQLLVAPLTVGGAISGLVVLAFEHQSESDIAILNPLFECCETLLLAAQKQAGQNATLLLDSFFESVDARVLLLDTQGRVVRHNNRSREFMNEKEEASVEGRTVAEFGNHLKDAQLRHEENLAVLTTGQPLLGQIVDYSIEGEDRHARVDRIPSRDAAGNVVGLVVCIYDMTDQTIERQRSELFHVSRLTTMGQMTAEISHEIKQPLAAIANYAGTCVLGLQKTALSQEQHENYLSLIVEQAKRADAIMERIQAFTRRGVPIRSICSVRELVRESIDVIRTELKGNGVKVNAWTGTEDALIEVDRVLIQQVIVNLLMNASDAMKGQPPTDRLVEIVCEFDESDVTFNVIDCGLGLEPNVIARVFDTFYTTKEEGMGIGLAICKEIVETHSGVLEAFNNSPRPGATFRFRIPRARGEINDG
jgi:signal transduction histidine kinase